MLIVRIVYRVTKESDFFLHDNQGADILLSIYILMESVPVPYIYHIYSNKVGQKSQHFIS